MTPSTPSLARWLRIAVFVACAVGAVVTTATGPVAYLNLSSVSLNRPHLPHDAAPALPVTAAVTALPPPPFVAVVYRSLVIDAPVSRRAMPTPARAPPHS